MIEERHTMITKLLPMILIASLTLVIQAQVAAKPPVGATTSTAAKACEMTMC